MRTVTIISLALIFLPLAEAKSNPQGPALDVPTAARQLVGGDSRTWVLERITVVLGGTRGCTSGETWRFIADHKVEIKACKNNRLVTETLNWSLSREGDLDTLVVVGDTSYYLVFSQERSATIMRLRTASGTKIEPRVTKEFHLQEVE
jgi:hypothetical protein